MTGQGEYYAACATHLLASVTPWRKALQSGIHARCVGRLMHVIDSIVRPLVLLDANAVRYCFKRQGFSDAALKRLRETMRELARQDLVRFIVSQPVGWELTQVRFEEGPQPYEDLVEFQLTIGSEWVLMNEHERRVLELRHGRRLRLSEAFPTRVDIPTSLAMHKDPDCVKTLHDMQRKHKDDERAKESAKRMALVPELDAAIPNWKTSLPHEATTMWDDFVRDLAAWDVREVAQEHGLAWSVRPDDLPTFWFDNSFYLAKFLSVFVDTKKELTSKNSLNAMPDMMDATHFRDAAYADVLVTQDENFLRVATKAKTGLRLLTFDDFARLVLAQAPALGLA
jgi:hypothetical protein